MTPPAAILAALGKVPGSLYLDHARRFGANDVLLSIDSSGNALGESAKTCGCTKDAPDDACQVGSALFRLRIREMSGSMVKA